MDEHFIDHLSRAIGMPATRRRLGALLLIVGLSAAPQPWGLRDTEAKKRRRRRKKRHCKRDCTNKTCGPDGCGGSCGDCGLLICVAGQCQLPCIPDCVGKICGPDGCGGQCDPGCNLGDYCSFDQTQCYP